MSELQRQQACGDLAKEIQSLLREEISLHQQVANLGIEIEDIGFEIAGLRQQRDRLVNVVMGPGPRGIGRIGGLAGAAVGLAADIMIARKRDEIDRSIVRLENQKRAKKRELESAQGDLDDVVAGYTKANSEWQALDCDSTGLRSAILP